MVWIYLMPVTENAGSNKFIGDEMKKPILSLVFLFLVSLAIHAQNLPTVSIVNNTGCDIYYLYISPADEEGWGDDLLGDDILEDGKTFVYRLPNHLSNVSVYDILAEDENEDSYFKWDMKLVNNARIVFTPDDLDD